MKKEYLDTLFSASLAKSSLEEKTTFEYGLITYKLKTRIMLLTNMNGFR